MWPWRRRSSFDSLNLPEKVFISHSYKDAAARKRLLGQLPGDIKPFVFPPITVPPEQMISDKLLDAIRDCDGLIYLQGGASARSFWVALERDYALRQSKPVFAFNSSTGTLKRDVTAAMDMKVFVSIDYRTSAPYWRVIEMLRERYVDVHVHSWDTTGLADWHDDAYVPSEIRVRIEAGGYLVVLWSQEVLVPSRVSGLPRHSDMMEEEIRVAQIYGRNRVLVALLDDTPPPVAKYLSSSDIVQVYGDEERPMTHRIDDLIVRLYWLIYRNSHQNQLS